MALSLGETGRLQGIPSDEHPPSISPATIDSITRDGVVSINGARESAFGMRRLISINLAPGKKNAAWCTSESRFQTRRETSSLKRVLRNT